jgi:hypothetical protein
LNPSIERKSLQQHYHSARISGFRSSPGIYSASPM